MEVEFYVEKNLLECEKLWKEFSTNENLSDVWEYRLCFHQGYQSEPYFIVGKLGEEIVGFLPLEFSKSAGDIYVFFGGGDWVEDHSFFIKKEYKKEYLPLFLKQCPPETYLWLISGSEKYNLQDLEEDQPAYFLNLEKFNYNVEEYFSSISGKWRQTLKREIRRIGDLQPRVVINNFLDFEKLVEFNQKKFGDESAFADSDGGYGFKQVFKLMIENTFFKDKLRMISVLINDEVKAVMLVLLWGGVYFPLQGGNDSDIPNLFKFLSYEIIKDAISLKMKRIYFMVDDCGWKEHWCLEKEMLYAFKNVL